MICGLGLMKISQPLRQLGSHSIEAIKLEANQGMEVKPEEFNNQGSEIYSKV